MSFPQHKPKGDHWKKSTIIKMKTEDIIMKKSKRIAALLTAGLLALTPCMLAGTTAFAADDDEPTVTTTDPAGSGSTPTTYTITVDADHKDDSAFAGYQIFTGNSSGGKLNDIEWGSAFPTDADRSALITALKGNTLIGATFSSLTASSSAADVADAMGKIEDTDKANELAKVIGKCVQTPVADATPTDQTIAGVPSGYYLVTETTDASQDNPITLNLLKVVDDDVTIETKEDLPSLDKQIDEEGGIDANTASVGDVVPFIMKSKVPDMTGYTKYFFVINDTLSKGLTYNDDMVITVNGLDVTGDCTITKTGTTNIEVVFKDFYKNYKKYNNEDTTDDDIVIKYSATVNNQADMTQVGNTNVAQLTYSNNPNETPTPISEEQPDKPKPDGPIGQTPQEKTVTYVTQIDILKVKPDGEGTAPLNGVEFKLEGYKKTVAVSAGKYYVVDTTEDAEYYRLADGTFTKSAPTDETAAPYYDSRTTKYKLVETEDIEDIAGEKITLTGTTAEGGKINFAGLGEGVYTITEVKTLDGYNKLQKPITVTITADATLTGCNWEHVLDDPNGAVVNPSAVAFDDDASKLELTILNTEGSTLPSTGGIGTKLFYLIGSLLAAGSGVVLVTKKRMANTEK